MRLTEFDGRRVGILGFGREGRATWRALRAHLPRQSLTLFCAPDEAEAARQLGDAALTIIDSAPTLDALQGFDIIVKSPGISPRTAAIAEASAAGVRFTSGSAIWFAEHPHARTICITGTKGKSTTSAVTAHLLRSLGVRTALCGNIGLPLLELNDAAPQPDCWVIELSSFQTRDFSGKPTVAVITNLVEEHLDWHGSVDQYINDKLCILGSSTQTVRVLNADDAISRARVQHDSATWFNEQRGWHVEDGHLCLRARRILPLGELSLAGIHNAGNACAALTAIAAAGFDALAAAPALRSFRPLPHRLQSLGVRNGIEYVNDSIATTPQACIAALRHYAGRNIALIIGGQDRGLDWTALRDQLATMPPRLIACTGAVRSRVLSLLSSAPLLREHLRDCADFDEAFNLAHAAVADGGVVLMSPGAPSFGQFRDYVQRGKRFAELAGFDPHTITGIEGLGIA